MIHGSNLKTYRKERHVSQTELAEALGKDHASHVCRMERRNLTPVEFTAAVAAVEKIVAERLASVTPANEVLSGDAA